MPLRFPLYDPAMKGLRNKKRRPNGKKKPALGFRPIARQIARERKVRI